MAVAEHLQNLVKPLCCFLNIDKDMISITKKIFAKTEVSHPCAILHFQKRVWFTESGKPLLNS